MNREATSAALAQLPTGLCVVSSYYQHRAAAMTASWVYQVSFDPPLLAVAVHKDRTISSPLRLSGGFVVSVLKRGQEELARHFSQHFDPHDDPFQGMETVETTLGAPALKAALCYLECHAREEVETGDHCLFIGEVTDGQVLNEGEPAIEQRRSGFDY